LSRALDKEISAIVVDAFVGSPAYKAGLRPNDVIVEVNDKSTHGLNSTEVVDLIKGPRGTPLQIRVVRGEGTEELTFNLIRDEIHRSNVPSAFMAKPEIGYIKIDEFIETYG